MANKDERLKLIKKRKNKVAKTKLILTFAVPTKRELTNGVC